LFHEDGQSVMTKLTVTFRDFANAPKNVLKFGTFRVNSMKSQEARIFVYFKQLPDVTYSAFCITRHLMYEG